MTDEEQGDTPVSGESTGDSDLDRQVAGLEQEGERVGDQIDETRSDWESKKGDQSVPGAVPDPDDEEDGPAEAEAEAEADSESEDDEYEVDDSSEDEDDASDGESEG
jgi:hypothetical protein